MAPNKCLTRTVACSLPYDHVMYPQLARASFSNQICAEYLASLLSCCIQLKRQCAPVEMHTVFSLLRFAAVCISGGGSISLHNVEASLEMGHLDNPRNWRVLLFSGCPAHANWCSKMKLY